MSSGVFLASGVVLYTFSHNYNDVVRLVNVLIIRYRFSCTIGRIEGKPVIFIGGGSIKLLVDVINHPTLFLLVKHNLTLKYDLYLLDSSRENQWELLNTTTLKVSHTESIILNIESLYNRYSTPEKFPRQGNNQQGKKLINRCAGLSRGKEVYYEILSLHLEGKYHQYNRAFIE